MTSATNKFEDTILKTYFIDRKVYISLHSSDPGDEANPTEIAGGAYARKEAPFTQELGAGKVTLATDLVWVNLPAVNIVAFAIWDAPTNGTMLIHQTLTAPKTVPSGEAFTLPMGNVTVTVD